MNFYNMWALTSPTGGGRSVGMVHSRTKATEFSFSGTFDMKTYVYVCCLQQHKIAITSIFSSQMVLGC